MPELKLSILAFYRLPKSATLTPGLVVEFQSPWYYLRFPTTQDCTLFTLRYSEYCKPRSNTYTIRDDDECND